MLETLLVGNYEAIGDICTIFLCVVMWMILQSTYASKNRNLFRFFSGTVLLIVASVSSIFYRVLVERITTDTVLLTYVCKFLKNGSLILVMLLFCLYLRDCVGIVSEKQRITGILMKGISFALIFLDLISPITKFGLYIDAHFKPQMHSVISPLHLTYIFFIAVATWMIHVYRKRFITKLRICLLMVLGFSVILMIYQVVSNTDVFTCISLVFPMMAVMYMFHYNGYDMQTGTLDENAFDAYVKELGQGEFSIIVLWLQETTKAKMQALSEHFFHFNEKFFVNPIIFRMGEGKFVLVYKDHQNPNPEQRFNKLLMEFKKLYQQYQLDYKIVTLHSDNRLLTGEQYRNYEAMVSSRMEYNSVYHCSEKDMLRFLNSAYVLEGIRSIHEEMNLDDPRVKVFAQPIWNARDGEYSSAEALMRIELPEDGMFYPDVFIPLAEKYGYIHSLSKIILHKTCKMIKDLENEGYWIERVSVNISIMELREKDFCENVLSIIRNAGVDYDKIAIELTESRNAKDYEIVREVVKHLKKYGIKFYLDDFGTGYSNMERILDLPIDIIKFDRSLTILSGKNEESNYLVGSFSSIFQRANYEVLFEGIEDENDERRCRGMNAHFLQGYKYSRPVPIEELRAYLKKM